MLILTKYNIYKSKITFGYINRTFNWNYLFYSTLITIIKLFSVQSSLHEHPMGL